MGGRYCLASEHIANHGLHRLASVYSSVRPCFKRHQRRGHYIWRVRVLPRPCVRHRPWKGATAIGKLNRDRIVTGLATAAEKRYSVIRECPDQAQSFSRIAGQQTEERTLGRRYREKFGTCGLENFLMFHAKRPGSARFLLGNERLDGEIGVILRGRLCKRALKLQDREHR